MAARGVSAKRYAQAVFQIGLERNELAKWTSDLQLIAAAAKSEEFRIFLEDGRVPEASKKGLLDASLKDLGPLARNFVGMLAARRSLEIVPAFVAAYQELLDDYYGRQHAEVTSAVPLEEAEKQHVAAFIKTLQAGKEIILDTRVDPAILGGLVVKVGSHLIDGSTRAKLEQLRQSLATGGTQGA